MNTQLAEKIRNAEQLTFSDKIKLIRDLSIPGILAVITETVMGFIDTAMVGAPVSYTHLTLPTKA